MPSFLAETQKQLSDTREPYVYCVAGLEASVLDQIVTSAAGDQRVFILDGREMRTIWGFFAEFADKFEFPSYFGENLNAFYDVMTDLAWLKASGFVSIVHHSDKVLANEEYGLDLLVEY
ncbi:MAG: barstar family protein, partial [Pseudomonadota bacterium]|nr:barstar family protein [Pseudomonadota bacterium]